MKKLKTKEELLEYIGENCSIRNSDGTEIGSTSGGFAPLFYKCAGDLEGTPLKDWDEAYDLYIQHNTRRNLGQDLLRYGVILKVNNFQTEKGYYTIRLIRYEGAIYFHKMKNGMQVEIKKLN